MWSCGWRLRDFLQLALDETDCCSAKKTTKDHSSSTVFRIHELGSVAPAVVHVPAKIPAVNCRRSVRIKRTEREERGEGRTCAKNMPGRSIVGAIPPRLEAVKPILPPTVLQQVVEAIPVVVGSSGSGDVVVHLGSQSLPLLILT